MRNSAMAGCRRRCAAGWCRRHGEIRNRHAGVSAGGTSGAAVPESCLPGVHQGPYCIEKPLRLLLIMSETQPVVICPMSFPRRNVIPDPDRGRETQGYMHRYYSEIPAFAGITVNS